MKNAFRGQTREALDVRKGRFLFLLHVQKQERNKYRVDLGFQRPNGLENNRLLTKPTD